VTVRGSSRQVQTRSDNTPPSRAKQSKSLSTSTVARSGLGIRSRQCVGRSSGRLAPVTASCTAESEFRVGVSAVVLWRLGIVCLL
jgi:hypothetical protein